MTDQPACQSALGGFIAAPDGFERSVQKLNYPRGRRIEISSSYLKPYLCIGLAISTLPSARKLMDVIGNQRMGKAGDVRFGNDGGKPVDKICTVGIRPEHLPTFDSA